MKQESNEIKWWGLVGQVVGMIVLVAGLFVFMFYAACGKYMGETKLIASGNLEKVSLGSVIPNSIIGVTIDGKKYMVYDPAYVDNYGNPKIGEYVYLYQRGIDGFGRSSYITYEPLEKGN